MLDASDVKRTMQAQHFSSEVYLDKQSAIAVLMLVTAVVDGARMKPWRESATVSHLQPTNDDRQPEKRFRSAKPSQASHSSQEYAWPKYFKRNKSKIRPSQQPKQEKAAWLDER